MTFTGDNKAKEQEDTKWGGGGGGQAPRDGRRPKRRRGSESAGVAAAVRSRGEDRGGHLRPRFLGADEPP